MPLFLAALLWCLLTPVALADVRLVQPDGSELHLEQPADTLVTLSPHLAELVFAAGSGSRLIATVEYSDFPEQVLSLPRVGDAFRIDLESVLALEPDLVIAWDSGNPAQAVEQLRALGLPVWSVEIRTPDQIAETLVAIGEATGMPAPAETAAGRFTERLESLKSRYSDRTPLNYFYQIAERPLYTINQDHLIAQGLALCGGHNVFAGEPGLAFQVSHEAVIVANPDLMFAPIIGTDEEPLRQWREWPGLDAVRNDALFLLPANQASRATPRWLEAMEIACRLMDDLPARRSHD